MAGFSAVDIGTAAKFLERSYWIKVFPNEVQASDVLWAWMIGEKVEEAIKSYRSQVDADETTDAILKRGSAWFAGWLFTIGYLHLTFWKSVLAIVLWPYYIGLTVSSVAH